MSNFLGKIFHKKESTVESETNEITVNNDDHLNMMLMQATEKDTPKMFEDDEIYVKVLRVYDGDTFWGAFINNNNVVKFSFRMMGYDSPELRISKKIEEAKRVLIKKWGINAKNRLAELMGYDEDNCMVKINTKGIDSRGRILAEVYSPKVIEKDSEGNFLSVNTVMINENHGYVYDGGTKIDQYDYFLQFNK